MFELGRAEFVKPLRSLFNLVGQTPMTLGSGLVPTVEIGKVGEPPYHSKEGFLYGGIAAAVAGNYAWIELRNLSTAKVVILKRVVVSCTLVGGFMFKWDPNLAPALALQKLPGSWDSRINQRNTQLEVWGDASTDGAAVPEIFSVRTLADSPLTVEGPWAIYPGDVFGVRSAGWNTTMHVNFYGDVYST